MSSTTQELPCAYSDISEVESIAYCLNYTMPPVISEFISIPDDKLFFVTQTGLIPAAWIMTHLITNEYRCIQQAFCLNDEAPALLKLCVNADDSEIQYLKELNPSKDELVGHLQSVRTRTLKQLMSLKDEQLKEVYPGQCQVCADHITSGKTGNPEPHECQANPFRELFVELITHQNYCLGQLHVIRCLTTATKDVWAKW